MTMLIVVGVTLALCLPFLSAALSAVFSLAKMACVVGLNFWLYLGFGLSMPMTSSIVAGTIAFVLNMGFAYFVKSRPKRYLAALHGTYVPPELVDEMVTGPKHFSLSATTRYLTVMFCDMRGFTVMVETKAAHPAASATQPFFQLADRPDPSQLQHVGPANGRLRDGILGRASRNKPTRQHGRKHCDRNGSCGVRAQS